MFHRPALISYRVGARDFNIMRHACLSVGLKSTDIEGTHGPQATKAYNFSGHGAGANDPRNMLGARMRPKPVQLMGHMVIIIIIIFDEHSKVGATGIHIVQ